MSAPETRARRRELAAGLGLIAIALAVAIAGGVIDPKSWRDPPGSASFFPALTLAGMVACGLAIMARAWRATGSGAEIREPLRTMGMGLIVTVYALLLPVAGFVASTIGLSVAVSLALGYRRWIVTAVFSAILIAFCWFVFIKLMSVPLDP